MLLLKICLLLVISFNSFSTHATTQDTLSHNGLEYKKLKQGTNIVHILTIDPKLYRLELVKAHNGVFGRETLPAIALRKNAIAAINAGFFEIGNSQDGRPSGNLIINGMILALSKEYSNSLILDKNTIDIAPIRGTIKIRQGDNELNVNIINQFAKGDEIALYNSLWGLTTLTPYKRHEFLISSENVITHLFEHGDSIIPPSGWILSIPNTSNLSPLNIKDRITLDVNFEQEQKKVYLQRIITNAVMGIPMLIDAGKITPELENFGSKSFTLQPHARTAVGFRADGMIIIAVAEHLYAQPLQEITIGQMQDILKKQGYSAKKLADANVSQVLAIVEQQLRRNATAVGLTLPELAKLMLELGCIKAINLDGGGSSTMFFDGQVVNATIGDSDEGIGQEVLRPISDAIVILKQELSDNK